MAGNMGLECYIVPKIQTVKQNVEDDGVSFFRSIHVYVKVAHEKYLVPYDSNTLPILTLILHRTVIH